jgi:hypothetical protein
MKGPKKDGTTCQTLASLFFRNKAKCENIPPFPFMTEHTGFYRSVVEMGVEMGVETIIQHVSLELPFRPILLVTHVPDSLLLFSSLLFLILILSCEE